MHSDVPEGLQEASENLASFFGARILRMSLSAISEYIQAVSPINTEWKGLVHRLHELHDMLLMHARTNPQQAGALPPLLTEIQQLNNATNVTAIVVLLSVQSQHPSPVPVFVTEVATMLRNVQPAHLQYSAKECELLLELFPP